MLSIANYIAIDRIMKGFIGMEYTISQANRENNRSFFKNEGVPIPSRKRWPSSFFDPALNKRSYLEVSSVSSEFHKLLEASLLSEK